MAQPQPSVSMWKVVAGQALVGVLVALVAWGLTGRTEVGWSAAYGALAVVAPAALFARGMSRQMASGKAGASMAGFFGWEMAKIVFTIALLAAALGCAGAGMAGLVGGHGGHDENVLGRAHGAAWCPKNRLI